MERFAMERLQTWKQNKTRKPLIIRGARQVGKTWLMKEFGQRAYANTVYVNLENNAAMRSLFDGDLIPQRIIEGLELQTNQKIQPEQTLIILDEIQEVPRALTALKYFNEEAPQYHVICAGSLLGVALHEGTSFPVGKVEFADLGPLSFQEFLIAMGQGRFAELLQRGDFQLASSFQGEYERRLKQYYYVGGMPEAVASFSRLGDFTEVREIQQQILTSYEQDFSKHAPHSIVPRIRMVWGSIPAQLSKENKKYVYGMIREGARAKDYEQALLWLSDCGLVTKIHRVSAPSIPLSAYEDLKAFKLFQLDVGLLACMCGLRQQTLLEGNRLFTEFKGALTEQYVLQQLEARTGFKIYYWTAEKANAEIDFLLDNGREIVPIEVKAEKNLKAKSLKVFREKYQPANAVRTSMAAYHEEDGLINLPLWAVEEAGQLWDDADTEFQ